MDNLWIANVHSKIVALFFLLGGKMKYEVSLEGSFLTEMIIEAGSQKEAEKKALEQFDSLTGLQREDYSVTSVITIPESV